MKNHKQSGAALIIALVFLLMLTIIGLTSSQVAVQQERMSGNHMESNLSLQTAESILRDVEQRLTMLVETGGGGLGNIAFWGDDNALIAFPADCTLATRYGEDWANGPVWQDAISGENGQYFIISLSEYDSGGEATGSACRPVGEMTRPDGTPLNPQFFLITVRGFGPGEGSRRAQSMAQAIFYREPSL